MIEQAKQILKQVFGYRDFRSLQEPVIKNVLAKKDTLVIMPTGGGKSLCYQIPAMIFDGLTVVVSPLISLMKDQVEQLRELKLPAILLNSSLSYQEYTHNVNMIRNNEAKLLYVAPETLLKEKTLELLSNIQLSCITIDEAHCISEWGHDFRPEYRQIMDVRRQFPKAVCMALTATATPRVQEDIKNTLNFETSNEFVASFNRDNLFLEIIPKQGPNAQVLRFLEKYKDQSGIVYCFTRRQVDELSLLLEEKGYSVKPYHAGLDEEERKRNQELFIRDDVQIIVATIAFGMGINKSNIRFVVHYDLPKNIESYYQEIGRSGRDGLRADCLLLFGYGDIRKIKYFIDQKEEKEQRVSMMHLNALLRFAETDVCRRIPLLNYFGEDYQQEDCGMCDNCVRQEKDLVDLTVPAQKFMSCARKTGEIFGAGHIIDVLRGSKSQKVIKFNHDQLSTYDIGKELTKKQWFHLSRQFIQKELLRQDPEYGSLKVTPKGIEVLRGREVMMGILHEDHTPEKVKTAKVKPTVEALTGDDRELFERLREKRKELARLYHLPPYVIFSDKTLIEMAVLYPEAKEDLLSVHGVGGAKLEKYGDIFFKEISLFRRKQQADRESGELTAVQGEVEPVVSGKQSYHVMAEAYNSGQSIEDVMREYGIKETTLIGYFTKYIQEGNSLRSDGLLCRSRLTPELQAQVMVAFGQLGAQKLAPVYNVLNGRVDYPDLRILQLYYLSCNF
ncbi:MAG: DNA helicase RecQ [bacterium]|nr:DNA helicase RecQ [bacterium]